MLPFGSHILFNILQNLNPKEDSTDFNKNVRKCARYGIVYFLHDNYESYCPFCFLKGKWCHLKERCFYSHYQICDDCKMFKSIIDNMNNNILILTAQFCSISNIFINSLCSKSFNAILQYSNPFFRCIKRNDIRNKIFELFDTIKYNIKNECSEEFCNILLDGATRNNKNFYCFIIHTKKRLFYNKIQSIEYSSSENIAQITAEIVKFIQNETNLEILTICTDHASNCIKAFNQYDQISLQSITGQFFEWIGCFCHLLNLSIIDLFTNFEFVTLYNSLNNILTLCKQIKLRKKIPSFSKTRWNSYSKCLNFLNDVKTELIYFFNLNIPIYNHFIEILNSDVFRELTELFNFLNHLSSEIGGDNFLICNVYSNIVKFESFLSNLKTIDIIFCGRIILQRIYSSDEYKVAVAAFFFTIDGRNHFLRIEDETEKQNFLIAIKEYIMYYNSFKFGYNEDTLEVQINNYINYSISPSTDPFQLWNEWRNNVEMKELAEIAIRILHMPCSELPVERAFSHMKYLFGSKNYAESEELLNSQMGIRMENVYSRENT